MQDVNSHEQDTQAGRLKNDCLLQSVLDSIDDLIWVTDQEGVCLLSNHVAEKATKLKIGDNVVASLERLLGSGFAETVRGNCDRVLRSNTSESHDHTLVIEGRHRTYSFTYSKYDSTEAQPSAVIMVGRDVTMQRAAERSVSQERMPSVAPSTTSLFEAVVRYGSNGEILECSSSLERMLGITIDNIRGNVSFEPYWRAIHKDGTPMSNEDLPSSMAVRTGTPNSERVLGLCRQADEAVLWLKATSQPIFSEGEGSPCGVFVSYVDITAYKNAEDKLIESEKHLADAQRIARLGSWDWEPTKGRVHWSDMVCELLGVAREDADRSFQSFLQLVHPDDRHLAVARVDALFAGANEFSGDLRFIKPSGDQIWLHSKAKVTRDAFGNIEKIEGTDQDITKRKAIEQRLKESQKHLQTIIQATPACIQLVDQRGIVREMNPTGMEMFQLATSGTIIGDQAVRNIAPEWQAAFVDFHGRVCAGECATLAYDIIGLSGRRLSVETHAAPLDIGGEIFFLSASLDVTERNRANEALRLAQFTIDNATVGIFWLRPDGSIADANIAAYNNLGYSKEELLSLEVNAIDSALTSEEWDLNCEKLRQQKWLKLIRTHRRKDGSTYEVELTSHHLSFDGSELICTFAEDITARKAAERDLKLTQFSVDHASDSIFWVNAMGVIVNANNAACLKLGYECEELVGRTVAEIDPAYKVDFSLWNLTWNNLKRQGTFTIESKHQTKDGRLLSMEINCNYVKYEDQEINCIIARDITERILLEENLRQTQKMEAIGRLAGGVAHDFNNLLTVINCHCELLLMRHTEQSSEREHFLAIQHAGNRAAELTAQLLAFSRKSFIEPKIIDLNELVESIRKLFRRLIRDDITLEFDCDSDLHKVRADPGQVEQIIMNLVVNAKDAMPSGGRLKLVTRNLTLDDSILKSDPNVKPGRYVCLEVVDTGHGIASDNLGKIFEPFFTTKEIGKGTGLGLAAVHGLMDQCGGHVKVSSTLGAGSTFQLFFPATEARDAISVSKKAMSLVRGAATVLVVEDETAVRDVARSILEGHGFHVLVADSGRQALEIIDRYTEPVHVMLTDVVMPEMNGCELAKVIRNRRPGLHAVFMSGHTDETVVELGLIDAGDAFVQKPFTSNGLVRKIREVLDSR